MSVTSKDLIAHVYEQLTERYGPSYLWRDTNVLPAGLRMEMHPSVYHTIRCEPQSWAEFSLGFSDDIMERFRVPVKITVDLPENMWRLVIVTEEVLSAGEFPVEVL